MKNSKTEVRVHRYGIMTIWSISQVKGPDKDIYQNSFEVCSREGKIRYNSRSRAKEHISYLLNSAPEEFKKELMSHKDILLSFKS